MNTKMTQELTLEEVVEAITSLPKGKASGLLQPHFGLSVKVKPTLPKVGSWSPPGLPKTQSAISGIKSPRI